MVEGISRELYSLIGGAPPIAFIKPNYKAKLSFQQKATPWYAELPLKFLNSRLEQQMTDYLLQGIPTIHQSSSC
jgi:hypothetical protein